MVPHIHTNDGLTVVIHGRPFTVAKDHKAYDDAVSMLSYSTEEEFEELLTRAHRALEEKLGIAADMTYSGGVIMYQGEVLHNYAADRLVSMIDAGLDYGPLAQFLTKLQNNPAKRVVDNLYEFMEKGNIPLTEDGDFLAYKAVRDDFYDLHSGTFFNGAGATCTMPRNKVDEDPDRTCSSGLHVCSFDYLPHFSHANGHVMIVKINPADVVAIPRDYNATKMRVAKYVVIDEVENYYDQREDVLGTVGVDTGVYASLFTIYDNNDEPYGKTYTLEEAKHLAREAFDESNFDDAFYTRTYVEDNEGFVVYEYDGED